VQVGFFDPERQIPSIRAQYRLPVGSAQAGCVEEYVG